MALAVDMYADSIKEVEESIDNSYRLGLLSGPQYDRLKSMLEDD